MSNIKHFEGFSIVESGLEIRVNMDRFNKQFAQAQYWLDTQIMTDMEPFMPRQTGTFISVTKAMSASLAGSGEVIAAAPPQGRFLYMGKVMVDPETNSPWARPGAKKIVMERPLTYSNPKAVPRWFDAAKKENGDRWVEGVKKRAGGG